VPYLFYQAGAAPQHQKLSGRGYNEPDAQATGVMVNDGYQLIERFVQRAH
jgi:hypothetical protein